MVVDCLAEVVHSISFGAEDISEDSLLMPSHRLQLGAVFFQRNNHIVITRSICSVFRRVLSWHCGKFLKLQVRELTDVILRSLQVDCRINWLTSIGFAPQSYFFFGAYLLIKTIDNCSEVIIRKEIQYFFSSYDQCFG